MSQQSIRRRGRIDGELHKHRSVVADFRVEDLARLKLNTIIAEHVVYSNDREAGGEREVESLSAFALRVLEAGES